MIRVIFFLLCGFQCYVSQGQPNKLFTNLPLGKFPVGFKILTFIDSSRVTKPEVNYFGERETGDLHQKITIHLWYPAAPNNNRKLRFEDYSYVHFLRHVKDTMSPARRAAAINATRENFSGFFGKISDTDWQTLLQVPLLASESPTPLKQKFPLLIGMLRPLSTTITNELLASNGYVVAMVLTSSFRLPLGYITDVADMQHAMAAVIGLGMVDPGKIGAFGFSGSGFSQVLLAMNDPRVKALADIESALYGENLFELLSSSNLYNPANLRVPFLHIYGRELGKSDKHFAKFHTKKYAHRYHLLLNYSSLHHWDVAAEGRASTTVLHLRGDKEPAIRATFELYNHYLLDFFDGVLNKSSAAMERLNGKKIAAYHDSLWTLKQYPPLPAPPDRFQFETIINRTGIDSAISLARSYYAGDTAVEFLHENALNALARQLRSQNRPAEGLALMKLAVEFHPQAAWLWNNLADMHENSGNKEEAIRCSEKVVELLKDIKGPEQSFDSRVRRSSEARLDRLRKQG